MIWQHSLFRSKKLIQSLRIPWSTYLVFGLGLWAYYQGPRLTKQLLAQQLVFSATPLTVTGTITAIDHWQTGRPKRHLQLELQRSIPALPTNVAQRLRLTVPQTYQLQLGDRVTFTHLKLARPTPTASGYHALRTRSWPAQITTQTTYQLQARATPNLWQQLNNFKQHLINRLKNKLNPTTFCLLSTIFLGHKTANDPTLQQQLNVQCQRWGLAHFLARAGLHMILLAFLLQLGLAPLLRSRLAQHLALLMLVLLYAALSWESLSFLRALSLVCLAEICRLSAWQCDRLHLLNLIASAMLLWQPAQLFFLDFQLSFALTYALVLVFRQNRYQIVAPA